MGRLIVMDIWEVWKITTDLTCIVLTNNLSNLWDAICEFRHPVPVKRVPFSEYWKIFREVLLESNGTAANYLRTSMGPKFPEQCRKAFALRSYQYHSIRQGEHPSPSMHYLHDLLRVIDEKMVLSDP